MAGLILDGRQIAAVLKVAVNELVSCGDVKIPSMHRVALFDGFLKPLATRLENEFAANMPKLKSYEKTL